MNVTGQPATEEKALPPSAYVSPKQLQEYAEAYENGGDMPAWLAGTAKKDEPAAKGKATKPNQQDGDDEPKQSGEQVRVDGDDSRTKSGDETRVDGDDSRTKSASESDDDSLPKGIQKRLSRAEAKHKREKAEYESRIAKLQADIEALQKTPQAQPDTPADAQPADDDDAAAQYKRLGIEEGIGPVESDYANQTEWSKDYLAWTDGKPLKHHKKLGASTGAPQDGQPAPQKTEPVETPAQRAERAAQEAINLSWDTLEAAFQEIDDEESFEKFYEAVHDKKDPKVPLDIEMLSHLASSEDGPRMAKQLLKSRVSALRIYGKPTGSKGKALDAMIKRLDRKENAPEKDDDGGVLPELRGGGSNPKGPDISKMSLSQFETWLDS